MISGFCRGKGAGRLQLDRSIRRCTSSGCYVHEGTATVRFPMGGKVEAALVIAPRSLYRLAWRGGVWNLQKMLRVSYRGEGEYRMKVNMGRCELPAPQRIEMER